MAAAGIDPLLMMTFGARQRGGRRLKSLVLLPGQKHEHIALVLASVPGAGEEGALATDDQRAAVFADARLALEKLLRRQLAAIVPGHLYGRPGASSGEVKLDHAPQRRRLLHFGATERRRAVFHLHLGRRA